MKTESQPVELVPASEVARAAGVAPATARRRLEAAGVRPFAVLHAGNLREPSPLFPRSELPALLNLFAANPTVAA